MKPPAKDGRNLLVIDGGQNSMSLLRSHVLWERETRKRIIQRDLVPSQVGKDTSMH